MPTEVILTKEGEVYNAYARYDSTMWGRGNTPAEALGNLIMEYDEAFNFHIQSVRPITTKDIQTIRAEENNNG